MHAHDIWWGTIRVHHLLLNTALTHRSRHISRVSSNASCARHKGYSVGSEKAAVKQDVLQMFVDSANAAGVGYGFYYSIMKNFFLCHSFSGTNSCMQEVLPGQHNYTQEEYTAVVKQQVCVHSAALQACTRTCSYPLHLHIAFHRFTKRAIQHSEIIHPFSLDHSHAHA